MTKHLILLQREQDEKELEKKIRVNLKIYQREPAVIEEPDVSEPESEEEEEQVESLPGTGVLKITKMQHGYWPSPYIQFSWFKDNGRVCGPLNLWIFNFRKKKVPFLKRCLDLKVLDCPIHEFKCQ